MLGRATRVGVIHSNRTVGGGAESLRIRWEQVHGNHAPPADSKTGLPTIWLASPAHAILAA